MRVPQLLYASSTPRDLVSSVLDLRYPLSTLRSPAFPSNVPQLIESQLIVRVTNSQFGWKASTAWQPHQLESKDRHVEKENLEPHRLEFSSKGRSVVPSIQPPSPSHSPEYLHKNKKHNISGAMKVDMENVELRDCVHALFEMYGTARLKERSGKVLGARFLVHEPFLGIRGTVHDPTFLETKKTGRYPSVASTL